MDFKPDIAAWRERALLSLQENQPRLFARIESNKRELTNLVENQVNNALMIYESMITAGKEDWEAYQVASEMVSFPEEPDLEDAEEKMLADFEETLIKDLQ